MSGVATGQPPAGPGPCLTGTDDSTASSFHFCVPGVMRGLEKMFPLNVVRCWVLLNFIAHSVFSRSI